VKIEDYATYWQKGGTYVLPNEIFYELFDEMNNWKEESQHLKSTLEEIREYIRDCCNMDVKIVNLHFDNAQNEMSADQVDDLLQIIDKSLEAKDE
jgi:hypothetical protein